MPLATPWLFATWPPEAPPRHDTLATFRRRFLDQLSGIFLQILELASEMKLLKLGTVCLDGTKIHANASRHSARSHGHIEKVETQRKAEVADLLAQAEKVDQSGLPDGMNLPDEIKRRQDRLNAMEAAKAKILACATALPAGKSRIRRQARQA